MSACIDLVSFHSNSLFCLFTSDYHKGKIVYPQHHTYIHHWTQHIFDRLNEAGVYEEEYLHPYKAKLDEIEKILVQDTKNDIVPEYAIQVLRYKFIQCGK